MVSINRIDMAGYNHKFAFMILRFPIAVALCGIAVASAQVSFPGIDQYGVGKVQSFTQTGPTQGAFADYAFEAFIDFKTGADVSLSSATLQGPLLGGSKILSVGSNGAEYTATFTGAPVNAKKDLDLDYEDTKTDKGNKSYDLSFTVTDGESTSAYTVNFPLSGDAYPQDVPTVTLDNGAWLSGVYQLDPSQTTNFGWAFANYTREALNKARFNLLS